MSGETGITHAYTGGGAQSACVLGGAGRTWSATAPATTIGPSVDLFDWVQGWVMISNN